MMASDLDLDRVASVVDYSVLASMTEGYLAMDLQDFVSRAVHQAAMRVSSTSGDEDKNTVSAFGNLCKCHTEVDAGIRGDTPSTHGF
jgi:hypothetical protein